MLDDLLGTGHALGALVSVPRRHTLLYHLIEPDAQAFQVALGVMWSLNRAMFEDGPGSISPLLYWWRRGQELAPIFALDVPLADDAAALAVGLPEGLMDLFGPSSDDGPRPN